LYYVSYPHHIFLTPPNISMTSLLRSYATFTAHTKPTVGDLKMSAVDLDHLGWLKCDGRSLTVSEWRFLFNAIGYQFGGSGASFHLPNAAGRVNANVGTSTGNTWALGDISGDETHTLTIEEMPAHKHGSVDVSGNTNGNGNTTTNGAHIHDISDNGHTHSYFNQPNQHDVAVSLTTTATADNVNVNQDTGRSFTGITIISAGAHNHQMGSTGGNQPHNNIQPTIFMGNTFIYSGRTGYGTWPLFTATTGYAGEPAIL
jgi:microcystin-dependent protein